MRRQGWSFPSTSSDAQDLHPTLKIFWAVLARNSGRDRRRYPRECGQLEARNEDGLEAGDVPPEPSDEETIPAEPMMNLTLLPHLHLHMGSQDPRLAIQMIPSPTGGTSPKRPGAPSDTLF